MRPEEGKGGQPTAQSADLGVGQPKTNRGSTNISPTGQSVDTPLFFPHKQERPLEKTLFERVPIRALFGRRSVFGPHGAACNKIESPNKTG
jgi:hypothetical protein